MKDATLKAIRDEYEDIKKISSGDFSEIEVLEANPIVQRYNYLLKLKDSRYELSSESMATAHFISKYGQGLIEESNDIWFLMYEISVGRYEEVFNVSLEGYDKHSIILVYFDLENNKRRMVIKKEEQELFESTHKVVVGKQSILDSSDRYYNTRHEFFSSCITEGQDKAVQKVLSKYSKVENK